ncbi:MAG: hypothetical protein MZV70_33890 [Desulfobacterales bacterium]|nr:hypothetical protein [Desulfobacterales bacterium]
MFALAGRGMGKHLVVNSQSGLLRDSDIAVTDKAAEVCPVGVILRKRVGFAVPVGSAPLRRPADQRPGGRFRAPDTRQQRTPDMTQQRSSGVFRDGDPRPARVQSGRRRADDPPAPACPTTHARYHRRPRTARPTHRLALGPRPDRAGADPARGAGGVRLTCRPGARR